MSAPPTSGKEENDESNVDESTFVVVPVDTSVFVDIVSFPARFCTSMLLISVKADLTGGSPEIIFSSCVPSAPGKS